MTPDEFLRAVWPSIGFYVLASPFKIPNTTRTAYRHHVFDSIDQAAAFVDQHKRTSDLFFGVHSLREKSVWNPRKENPKTGEPGAWEVRTQANSLAARCLFFDLDVGDSAQKYPTQGAALGALRQFCGATKLPKPLVVSSGGGLHIYWLFTEELPSAVWRDHAGKLRALAAHHGLKVDPSRTIDSASVLRVVGSYNLKDADNPRLVVALTAGVATSTDDLIHRLDDALVRSGTDAPVPLPAKSVADIFGLGNNLQEVYDGPPVTLKAMVTACAQLQGIVRLRGNVSEPVWYHTLNLVRFVENGAKLVHKVSEGYPGYSPHETDAKVAQLESREVGPTSCLKLSEVNGDAACQTCPFLGKVKSPIVAARYKDPAPAPIAVTDLGNLIQTVVIPDPPAPYIRMKNGSIAFHGKDKDGDEVHTIIYDNDLYPVYRVTNATEQTEQQVWRVVTKLEGTKEFTVDADALYDRAKFIRTIAHQGIYPQTNLVQYVQEYMVAYIKELQRLAAASAQNTHLGWADEHRKFILPDRILCDDGSVKASTLGADARQVSEHVHKRGTIGRQIELLNFYNHPAYIQNQFLILGGLAAPLFSFTDHAGVIINASGEAGSSKSTSLYTAASFWGDPQLYTINGTKQGSTIKGQINIVETFANLPICVDEITKMSPEEASNLALGITQPGRRVTQTRGGMQKVGKNSEKSTIMLTTANKSLHGLLSMDNSAGTAGSMRVVEMLFRPTIIHQKREADDYLHELNRNYGHLGEVFMAYVVQNQPAIGERVRQVIREIDDAADVKSAERFWSAAVAAVLVAGEIANTLGLVKYDPVAIREWVLNIQFPLMRGVVISEYSTPLGMLTDYLAVIHADILVAGAPLANSNLSNVIKAHRGALLGHYDPDQGVMWVLKKGFRDFCTKSGADYLKILNDLHAPQIDAEGRRARIVLSPHMRKVLGSQTIHAQSQSWCFAVNMRHPEVAGVIDPTGDSPPNVLAFKPRGTN